MNAPFPLRAVAGCFALACFGVALLAGLGAARDAADILRTAILALVVGQVVGLVGGWAIARAFGEALETYKHPAVVGSDGGVVSVEKRAE